MCGLYLLTALSNNHLLRNDISDVMTTCLEKVLEGLCWWPSGQDCVSTAGTQVRSLVRELKIWHAARCRQKKKKIAKRNKLLDVPISLSFFALILRRRFHFEICLP